MTTLLKSAASVLAVATFALLWLAVGFKNEAETTADGFAAITMQDQAIGLMILGLIAAGLSTLCAAVAMGLENDSWVREPS